MKKFLKWTALALVALFAGTIALFWAPDISSEELRETYANENSRFVGLGIGVTVHVRDEGPRDAPVLFLLHGSNASLHTWEPWVARLADDYRVISIDQIGHGLTGPHPYDDYSPAAFVATVEGVADALSLDRFVLAGNSMGGSVAWNYALTHPERLTGLILVDAGGAPDAQPESVPIGFRIASMPVIREVLRKVTPRAIIERSLRQSVSNQDMIDDAMVDRYWELLRHPGNRRATGLRFAAERRYATAEMMAQITMPTLIIWGDEDRLIPLRAGEWFAEHIPDARLIHYADIGHIPMEEAPDRSAADVRAFLEEIYPVEAAAEAGAPPE